MKQKLFNVIVYTMLTYSFVTTVYLALPADIQAMIPYVDKAIGIYSAVLTAIGAGGGLAVQAYISKAAAKAQEKENIMVDKFLTIVDGYNVMSDKVQSLMDENSVLTESINKLTKLVSIDLKTKLSNPMIELTARQEIEGALYGEQEE